MSNAPTIYKPDMLVLPRWGVALHVALEREGRGQWFPLRALCTALGVSWGSQSEVIKNSPRLQAATRMLTLQTDAGKRSMLCMKRPELGLWLAGIDPQRVAAHIREDLEAFQVELMNAADQLLWPSNNDRPAMVAAAEARGVLSQTARVELTLACEDCGGFHRIVVENGVVTVTRQ